MDKGLLDRAAGVFVAAAAGDALGAGYEFEPPERIPARVGMIGGGIFGWEPGEWTDDTSMAWVIADAAASGADLLEAAGQDRIAAGWCGWLREATDVGNQTRAVLLQGGDPATARALREAAARHHTLTGRSGGNGSLMRTAPVALAYLHDPEGCTRAAREISALTHADPEAGDACVLACQAVRHAVLTGDLNLWVGLSALPAGRRGLWAERLEAAEDARPQDFSDNGWVVEALQGAWSAVCSADPADPVRSGLQAAVLGGNDTDTVAAIAGGLLGAAYGASAVPAEWVEILHGWPGKRAADLGALARAIVSGRQAPAVLLKPGAEESKEAFKARVRAALLGEADQSGS